MHRRQPSAALPLSTRAVTSPEPDVLVAHLAIRLAGDYDLIGRPVVHDGLARFLSSRHDRVQFAEDRQQLHFEEQIMSDETNRTHGEHYI